MEKRRLGGEGATLHQKDVPLPANTDFSYPSPLTPLAVLRMARVTALELFLQIGIFRHSLLMAAHAGLFGLLAVSYTHLDVYKRQGLPSREMVREGHISLLIA